MIITDKQTQYKMMYNIFRMVNNYSGTRDSHFPSYIKFDLSSEEKTWVMTEDMVEYDIRYIKCYPAHVDCNNRMSNAKSKIVIVLTSPWNAHTPKHVDFMTRGFKIEFGGQLSEYIHYLINDITNGYR